MIILLTNDDGVHAQGINTLFDVLSLEYDVYMIAPSEERSACSNAITMRSALTVRQLDERKFSVNGFPADCSNVGLHGNIIPDPDLVISGINHGSNMGDDIYYSGTVGGARVGFIHGKTGIAVSLATRDKLDFLVDAATYTSAYIAEHRKVFLEKPRFLNINYPAINKGSVKGTAYTFLDKRRYEDRFILKHSEGKEKTIMLEGTVESAGTAGSDFDMTRQGYVSVTPLQLDSTNYKERDYFSSL